MQCRFFTDDAITHQRACPEKRLLRLILGKTFSHINAVASTQLHRNKTMLNELILPLAKCYKQCTFSSHSNSARLRNKYCNNCMLLHKPGMQGLAECYYTELFIVIHMLTIHITYFFILHINVKTKRLHSRIYCISLYTLQSTYFI